MKNLLVAICTASLTACASTPDVTLNYYPAKSVVAYKVIRTISCDASNIPIVANQVTATTNHSSDLSSVLGSIKFDAVDGTLANSDIKVELYEDGRLKGLNATTTGQGESVVKSAISLAAAAAFAPNTYVTECSFIRKTGNGKPLTLTFSKTVNPSLGSSLEIPPDLSSKHYYNKLSKVLGKTCVSFANSATKITPATSVKKRGDTVITVMQPGRVASAVRIVATGVCNSTAKPIIWEGEHVLAQFGQSYNLLIPRAAVFGKQIMELTLSESGALTTLRYGKETGTAQVINLGGSLQEALANDTPAERAAAIKAEADIIAQQERLVRCLADRTNCT